MSGLALLHPALLWMLPAGALPVLVHFYMRRRTRELRLPTLMFLLQVDPRMRSRRRLREWLLLVLRTVLVLLIVLALSRPRCTAWGEGAQAVALLVDNSASMALPAAGGGSRLDRARRIADAVLDHLDDGDTACVRGLVDDPALGPDAGFGGNVPALRIRVDRLRPTHAAASVGDVLRRTMADLAAADHPARVLHLVTDAQRHDWELPALPPQPGLQVIVHRVPGRPAPEGNLVVDGCRPSGERVLAGREPTFRVRVRNPGEREVAASLRCDDESGASWTVPVRVPAGADREVPVVGRPGPAGRRWLQVELAGDGFAGDNRAAVVYRSREPGLVLLAGGCEDHGFLASALAPAGDGSLSGLVPRRLDPEALPAALAEDDPVLVVLSWDDLPGLAGAMESWVRRGGRLLLLPATDGKATGSSPSWAGFRVGPEAITREGLDLVCAGAAAGRWPVLRDADGEVRIQGLRCRRHRPLTCEPGAGVLLATAAGEPVLAEFAVGDGLVFASGMAFAPAWCDLVLKPSVLPLVQGLAIAGAVEERTAVVAGWRPSRGPDHLRIEAESGTDWAWQGTGTAAPPLVLAGVYRCDRGRGERLVAVRCDEREGDPQVMPGELPPLAAFPQRVLEGAEVDRLDTLLAGMRRGTDLTPWLWLAALLVLVVEGLAGTAVRRRGGERSVRSAPIAAGLIWHPLFAPGVAGTVILLVVLVAWWLRRRAARILPGRRGLLVWAPRAAALGLMLVALLGPSLHRDLERPPRGRVLVLVDESSSMDLAEAGRTRRDLAWELAGELRARLPSSVSAELRPCGTELGDAVERRPGPPRDGVRPGDLGAVLAAAQRTAGDALALVVITDGGDRPPRLQRRTVPVSVLAVGGDGEDWRDCAVADVEVPPRPELGTVCSVAVDCRARWGGDGGFRERLEHVVLALEEERDGAWRTRQEAILDLRRGRARQRFDLRHEERGRYVYRVGLRAVDGELTVLNNRRVFTVDVAERDLRVLYYAERLGLGYKLLRTELASDPGIRFTALYRVRGARYLVQGPPLAGVDKGGFPRERGGLEGVDVVVLAPAASGSWPAAAQRALADWVAAGGSLVLVGGDPSPLSGAYAGGPMAALCPFREAGAGNRPRTGRFPVLLAAGVAAHPVLAGIEGLNDPDLAVASCLVGAAPKRSARELLSVSVEGRPRPLLLAMPYGHGRVLALASDSFWRLGRADDHHRAVYGRLWRQALRHLGEADDGAGILRVVWDRPRYCPGATARLELRVDGEASDLRLLAEHRPPGAAEARPLPVRRDAVPGRWRVAIPLPEWGEHAVRVDLLRGDRRLERYERTLAVRAGLPEGARLAVDREALAALAERGDGILRRADDPEAIDDLRARICRPVRETRRRPLAMGNGVFLVILLLLLTGEWIYRRWVGLP